MPALPDYYSSLAPFRESFRSGLPILTYHKLGPRPARVRLKGLYVGGALFERQLAELKENSFQAVSLSQFSRSASVGSNCIVITFDDGFRNVLDHGLPALARHGFSAIQFLLPELIGKFNEWEQREGEAPEQLMDEAGVHDWLAAGHEIGSHTCTHPWLTRLPLDKAKEEIEASRKKLEDKFQSPIRHFCYPYGDWNEAVRELVVEAGYETACTTEAGVNLAEHSPHALKRFTARYPSRNLKAVWQRLKSS